MRWVYTLLFCFRFFDRLHLRPGRFRLHVGVGHHHIYCASEKFVGNPNNGGRFYRELEAGHREHPRDQIVGHGSGIVVLCDSYVFNGKNINAPTISKQLQQSLTAPHESQTIPNQNITIVNYFPTVTNNPKPPSVSFAIIHYLNNHYRWYFY